MSKEKTNKCIECKGEGGWQVHSISEGIYSEKCDHCSGSGIEPTPSKEQQKKALIELTQMGEPKEKTIT